MLPVVELPDFGGFGEIIVLATGRSVEMELDLTDGFPFEEPGTYWVRGSYAMELLPETWDEPFPLGPSLLQWEDSMSAEWTVVVQG